MVDEKKEKQQRCLRVFNSYFPSYNREDGCIKVIKEDLERIKKISNLEEKGRKSHFYWTKHRDDEIHASSRYSSGNLNDLGISRLDTIEKYRKLIKELRELGIEATKRLKTERERERERERETKPSQIQSPSSKTQSEQDSLSCSSCATKIPSTYYYYKPKPNDKFCSNECLTNYHGKECDNCQQKFLPEQLSILDKNYPNLIYCFSCIEKLLKEEEKTRLEAIKYCKFCGIQLEEKKDFLEVCLKEECLRKFWGIEDEVSFEEKQTEINKLEKKLIQGEQEEKRIKDRTNELQNEIKENNSKIQEIEGEKKEIERGIEQNQTNQKLYLGIGLGVLGGGIVGVVLWLAFRKRK